MKHIKPFFLLLLLAYSSTMLYAENPKREFRATWVATVSSIDWPNVKNNAASQKAALDDILDAYEQANLNAICFQVRSLCDAMYKSSYEPWSSTLTGSRGTDPGYDPLAYLVEEAHKRGLEIHAWVNPFRYETSASAFGTDDPVRKRMSKYIISYSNGSYNGTILDPGYPEVREYTVDVIKEVVQNYDIDGVLFDDYFYPYGGTTTEDATAKSLHKTDKNQTDEEWRCENIDKAMKAVYDMIQEEKPWVRFGIAPFGIWTTDDTWADKYGISLPKGITGSNMLKTLGCNTISWMDGGYVDYVSPQLYWATTNTDGQAYATLSKWWSDMAKHFTDKRTDGKKIHFYSSQACYRDYGNDEMGLEIGYNRQYDQLDASGSIFYNTNTFISTGLPAYLSADHFSTPALPPAMDWKETTVLASPTNVTLSGSTLSWAHPVAERFTVYAYEKGSDPEEAMADPSNLVGVVYGEYGKSIDVRTVSNYALKTFAVCAYDRYGNEYTPGFYNAGELTPALVALQSDVTITGKANQTPQPYADITILGDHLNEDITLENTASSAFTVEKLSDWSDRAGGTLRVYLNTSLVVGDYNGAIVATSDTLRVQVNITATIHPLVPTLTASHSNVTLTGTQNSSRKNYQDIIITGEDLLADISISNTVAAVTYECLTGWDARTGGTLRIHLNTLEAVGPHTGTITLQSGAEKVDIAITATIAEPLPDDEEPQAGTVALSLLWKKTIDEATYLTGIENRSIVYDDNQLYIPTTSSQTFSVINAENGALVKTLNLGVSSTYEAFNLCMTTDGQLLAGNSNLKNDINVYVVDKENGGSSVQGTGESIGRSDYFDVYGNWEEEGYVLSVSNDGTVAYVPFKNGDLQTGRTYTHSSLPSGGISTRVAPLDEESFLVNSSTAIPTKHSLSTGELLDSFGDTKPASVDVSGLATFILRGNRYLLTPADMYGGFDIFDITQGLSEAKAVIESTAALGTTSISPNPSTVDFAVTVEGNDAYIYALAPANGIGAYKLTFTPDATTDIDGAEVAPMAILHSTRDGVRVCFAGEQMLKIYSINGTLLCNTIATDEYTATLQKGVYIIQVGNEVHKFVN